MPEAWNVLDYSNRTDFPQRSLRNEESSATDLPGYFSNWLISENPCRSVADRSSCKALHKLNQAAQRNPRRTLGNPRLLIFRPCGAGDVEMDPRRILRELFQEHGGRDGAAPAPRGVDDVGDRRADLLSVLVVERHAPHLLSSDLIRAVEAVVHVIVVGKNPGIVVTQSNHHCASERSGIDQMRAAELASVKEPVGQHQAA